ncbi:hypothetical protein G7Y89_g9698 [Cudoniella acicularis]|uniref:Tyrosinase copper-binding domain-containing protein n=1 Tax=Cudoniella acicularis TaxID=354080 RepID=A0A8H4W2C0_9HELO|nr:hypothetical protein G7Y89_g9698 [Cudoniella acicularis]
MFRSSSSAALLVYRIRCAKSTSQQKPIKGVWLESLALYQQGLQMNPAAIRCSGAPGFRDEAEWSSTPPYLGTSIPRLFLANLTIKSFASCNFDNLFLRMLIPSLFTPWGVALAAVTCFNLVAANIEITGVNTGVNAKTGYRPPRRNILDLYNDKAMNTMMQTDEHTLTSFFQIAGIHGRPFISWDGVNPSIMAPAANATGIPIGYCTHGNTLFPLWHRPYLALIEQVMAAHAQDAAKSYNSPVYQTAADNLRIPYWDWAAVPQRFPDLLMWPSIQIITPTGVKNVTNPLNRYKFLNHPEPEAWFPSDEESYLGSQPWTLRQPDSQNVSQEYLINTQGFGDDGQILTDSISTDWWNASTTAAQGYSFEGPHGSVHLMVGGNGHMSPATFAGFDPVFFLHHANVDRLWDMWQAVYPNSWIQPSISQGGTWTIYPNTIVHQNTPLTPFTTRDGKTPYTSVSARHVKYFGYSYPDVQDWLFTNPKALSSNVTTRINQLYNADGHNGNWPNKKTLLNADAISRYREEISCKGVDCLSGRSQRGCRRRLHRESHC